ncbi:SsrA-binding protein, partial [Patescibacteria group bacterium]|nr:SsrA-binding protein [Patescibacteria group bacterium]
MKKLPPHILADNRVARFHFEILETFEAGIILTGREAKSLRAKSAKLSGSFLAVRDGEVWIKNFEIPEYKFARGQPHEKLRDKKLLLTSKEVAKIEKSLNEKGIAAVPLDLHLSHSKIKV